MNEKQLLGVNVYNWTQQVWDDEAKRIKAKKWRDLDTGFQSYLLDKTQDSVSYEDVKNKLESK